MKSKHVYWLALFMLSVTLSSCLSDEKGTIALPVTSTGEVDERAIPNEIRQTFGEYVNLYEGTTPPTITGYYLVSPMTAVYCSDENGFEPGRVVSDVKMHFGEQTSRGIIVKYEEKENSSVATAENVQITGSGSYFTVCFISNSTHSDGSTAKQSTVISGKYTGYGIENLQYAFIMLEKYDPNNVLMPVNAYRVFTDGDGIAYEIYSGDFAPARKSDQPDKGGIASIAGK